MKAHPAADLFPMLSEAELQQMAADMEAHGQRHPVIITRDPKTGKDVILDGRNRTAAYALIKNPKFKLKTVRWADEGNPDASPTRFVVSLNIHRRHLSESQRGLIAAELVHLFAAEAKARQRAAGGDRRSVSAPGREAVAKPTAQKVKGGKATEAAGAALGVSSRTVERAKAVHAKASREDIEAIRAGKKTIKKVERELKKKTQLAQIRVYRPPEGKFQLITTDFPWKYRDDLDGSDAVRGHQGYPKMTAAEICAFVANVLAGLCEPTCFLGVWVTNGILIDLETWPVVQRAIEQVGFRPRQVRTWVKTEKDGGDHTGLGTGLRNDTEHLVTFTRGPVVFNDMGAEHGRPIQRTSFRAPIGEPSEKPAVAYTDLEQLVPYTSRLELFARDLNGKPAQRAGWVTSGSEAPKANVDAAAPAPTPPLAPALGEPTWAWEAADIITPHGVRDVHAASGKEFEVYEKREGVWVVREGGRQLWRDEFTSLLEAKLACERADPAAKRRKRVAVDDREDRAS